MMFLEEDKTVSLVNNEFVKLSGYSKEEIENKMKWVDFIAYKEDLERMSEYHRIRRIDVQNAPHTYEFKFRNRSGEIRDIIITVVIFPGTKRSLASLLDITDRILAEEKIKSANRQLEDIIEFLPDATFILGKDKKIIAWNRAMVEMTGVANNDMIGKEHSFASIPFYGEQRHFLVDILETDNEELRSKYKNIFKKGNVLYAEAFAPFLFNEKGAYIFAAACSLFDSDGNVIGSIESIRDITEQKKAEEEIRNLNAELEQRVIERTRQLEEANKELESFSYSVSHDLRAPLRRINGFSQILFEDYENQLNDQGKDYLKRLRIESQRMELLIDSLLKLSRVIRTELIFSKVNLSELSLSILKDFAGITTGTESRMHHCYKNYCHMR